MAEPAELGDLRLGDDVLSALRGDLPAVSEHVVAAVIAEVPSYSRAFAGPMGQTIRTAVAVALGGFLDLTALAPDTHSGTPLAPALEGAYDLGRGEARSGRSMEALLAAYRVGARVAWRGLSDKAVSAGADAASVVTFAELVFAYIDELSAASVAGHADELETTGRVHQRLLERLGARLVAGAPADAVVAAADRAEWEPPATLTAVLLPPAQVRAALTAFGAAGARTLVLGEESPGLDPETTAALLVPDAERSTLRRSLSGRSAVIGPVRPWLRVEESFTRAVRAWTRRPASEEPMDTDEHLAELIRYADPTALADLRTRALSPLDELRPPVREKLEQTLRLWLLCQGRRDDVAQHLFVHPQTVRYRMGQLRELFGDRLEAPETVLELTMALGPMPG
jgi:hypothetical protein